MSNQVKKLYIAGPMTGLPQFNIPAFERAAAALRASGYEVVSPVELDSEAIRSEALASADGAMPACGKIGGETWGEILARDVQVIADTVDGIAVLPNWFKSRGARLEVFVALLCKKPVYVLFDVKYPDQPLMAGLAPMTTIDIIFAITKSFVEAR